MIPTSVPDSDAFSNELTSLQLRVARRADELARLQRYPTPLNIHCWLQAEVEMWPVAANARDERDEVAA